MLMPIETGLDLIVLDCDAVSIPDSDALILLRQNRYPIISGLLHPSQLLIQ